MGGTDGYVFADVVNISNCPDIEPDGIVVIQPQLCHLTVGYDSPTWSENPEVPSYTYAAFWFAAAPGTPIPAGTPAWGVIYVAPYITLPDSDNVFAVATDPATMQAALDAEYAGDFNWPTEAGGIESADTILYRLTGENGGNCGPIVNTNVELPLTSRPADDDTQVFNPPIDQYACTISTAFNWIFAFNYAPGDTIPLGTHPLAILSGDFENYGVINQWVSEIRILNDIEVEYMTYGTLGEANYMSLPRSGGTCGTIGDSERTARIVIFNLPPSEGQTGSDLLIVNNGDGSDFLEDGDLDLYLVNIPGGGYPPPEFPWQVSWQLVLGGNSDGNGNNSDTVEICYYAELYEVGVYNEVCFEVEVPDGCVLLQPEAGVYIIECEEETVQINPLFDGSPIIDLQGTQGNAVPIGIGLQIAFEPSVPDPVPSDGQPETVEYCVYEEVHEAGVFEEVCYEVEIPEGCVLTSVEAGVFTMDCEDDTVTVNPIFDNAPNDLQASTRPIHDSAMQLGETLFAEQCDGTYMLWWEIDDTGQLLLNGECLVWR